MLAFSYFMVFDDDDEEAFVVYFSDYFFFVNRVAFKYYHPSSASL